MSSLLKQPGAALRRLRRGVLPVLAWLAWLAAAWPQAGGAAEFDCARRGDALSRALCPDAALLDADRRVDALLAEARRTLDPGARRELEARHAFWRAELPYHCAGGPKPLPCAQAMYQQHLDFLSSRGLRWFGEWQAPDGKRLVVTTEREQVSLNVSSRSGAAVASAVFGAGDLRLAGESRLAGQLQQACRLRASFAPERPAPVIVIRAEGACGGYDPAGRFVRAP